MKLTGQRNQCAGCGELFNRNSTFDRHRTGKYAWPAGKINSRRCLTEAEMLAKGWSKNAAGFWIGKKASPDHVWNALSR